MSDNATQTVSRPSRAATIIGWVLAVPPCGLLLFSAFMKFNLPPEAGEQMSKIGWSAGVMPKLGVVEAVSTLLYLFPKTAVLGAILLTGYMGGAIATHLRVEEPFIMQSLIGVVLWLGLFLRMPRLRALIPFVTRG